MKFILYLYYLIYQITDKLCFFIYKHSLFTPKADSISHDNWPNKDFVIFYAEGLFAMGQFSYIFSFIVFLYFIGFKEPLIWCTNHDNFTIFVIALLVICGIFDYLFIDRKDRYKKYFKKFKQFSFEQKMTYGTVALILFCLPIYLFFKFVGMFIYGY